MISKRVILDVQGVVSKQKLDSRLKQCLGVRLKRSQADTSETEEIRRVCFVEVKSLKCRKVDNMMK